MKAIHWSKDHKAQVGNYQLQVTALGGAGPWLGEVFYKGRSLEEDATLHRNIIAAMQYAKNLMLNHQRPK